MRAVLILCSAMLAGDASAEPFASFHVGNSLTWDSQPYAMPGLIGQLQPVEQTSGVHIYCSRPLIDIWNDPTNTCIDPTPPFGVVIDALPGHAWDAVTFQPHSSFGSRLGDDVAAIQLMTALAEQHPANTGAEYFIYAGWPRLSDFEATWHADVVDDDATRTTLSAAYFDILFARLAPSYPGRLRVVPVGWVLDELRVRIARGAVPGIATFDRLYRDDIHVSYDFGRYVASVTTVATLFETPPQGLVSPADFFGGGAAFTNDLYDALHDAIWDVVASHPHALRCRADVNRDGSTNFFDVSAYLTLFRAADRQADFNADGRLDFFDVSAFVADLAAGCP